MLHPIQEFIRHGDAVRYEEMRTWSVRPDEGVQYALYYVEADLEAYRRAVEGVETIVDCQVTPIDERSAHVWVCERVRPEHRAFFAAFTDRDLIVVPPIRFDREATMGMTIVGDGSDIQRTLEDLPPDVEVTVNGIGTYDRRGGSLACALTDRQSTAVRTALEMGYYDVPRQVTLEEVADELECARSTASVLLRRAERTVLSRVLEWTEGTDGSPMSLMPGSSG